MKEASVEVDVETVDNVTVVEEASKVTQEIFSDP